MDLLILGCGGLFINKNSLIGMNRLRKRVYIEDLFLSCHYNLTRIAANRKPQWRISNINLVRIIKHSFLWLHSTDSSSLSSINFTT